MAEYERVLEEEAFPFEEKAISFHEKNVEMMRKGTFNAWTEKSLGKLAEMVPGRYAKREASNGFLETVDTYVYRTPVSQAPPPAPAAVGPAPPPEPAPAGPPAPDKDKEKGKDKEKVNDAKP
jgi:hypothetical protein